MGANGGFVLQHIQTHPFPNQNEHECATNPNDEPIGENRPGTSAAAIDKMTRTLSIMMWN